MKLPGSHQDRQSVYNLTKRRCARDLGTTMNTEHYSHLFSLRSASFASIPSPMQYTLKASFRPCLARGQSLNAVSDVGNLVGRVLHPG